MSSVSTTPSAASVTAIKTPVTQMEAARRATKIMLGIASVILISAGTTFYLFNCQIQSIEQVEQNKESQVGSNVQIARRYDATLTTYNSTCDQLRFLEKPVAQNAFVATLLPQMQKLAQSNECEVKSMTPAPLQPDPSDAKPAAAGSASAATPAAAPAYQIMPLTVSVSGNYEHVMQFVYSLTRFPKIVTLKTISLRPGGSGQTPPGATPDKDAVSAELQLTAYLFPALPQAGTPASSSNPPSRIGVLDTTPKGGDDPVTQSIKTPIAAAMAVQSASQQRVRDSGLAAEPTPQTLPTNPSLVKK